MEDSIGFSADARIGNPRPRERGKAHSGAVNGLTWSDDGQYLVSAGHDARVRVWDASTGANTLASFGPTLKNVQLARLPLLATPTALSRPGKELLLYPNEQEILLLELHEGRLCSRLRVPGPTMAAVRASRSAQRAVRNRVTDLAWWGVTEGVLSGHSDGLIRAWVPRVEAWEDGMEEDDDDKDGDETDETRRKRKVLDDVFRDLTSKKITFG